MLIFTTSSTSSNAGAGGPPRVYRITNVRANANGLGASQRLIPTQIVAF